MIITELRYFSKSLQCYHLDIFMLNFQSSEQALHYKVALLFDLEVLPSLADCALEGSNRNLSQIWHCGINIADRGMEDFSNLLVGKFLVDVLVKELTKEAQSLDRGKSVLQIGIC